jgi:hypothetical protein
MKKFVLVVAAFLLMAMSGYSLDFQRNEISVSYGVSTSTEITNVFADVFATMITLGQLDIDDPSFSGAISASYIYRLNKTIGVGGIFSYEHSKSDITSNKEDVGDSKDDYCTIMPAAKFNWTNGKMVRFYSKCAAGVMLDTSNQTTNKTANTEAKSENKTDVLFAFQVSPLGLEVGTSLCGFAEVGFGCQGLALIGLKYRF